MSRAEDPDLVVTSWLAGGAPCGISMPIPAGGLFSLRPVLPELTVAELEQKGVFDHNHPSFDKSDEDGVPGIRLIEEHIEAGFGRLFTSRVEAEAWLGGKAFPAPMGNVFKTKPDGSLKQVDPRSPGQFGQPCCISP